MKKSESVSNTFGCSRCCSINESPTRLHEGHWAIRFGDDPDGIVKYKNKEINDCDEVLAGTGGFARRYVIDNEDIALLCFCGSGEPLMYIHNSDDYSLEYRRRIHAGS